MLRLIASRSIAIDSACRTRLSANGFLPLTLPYFSSGCRCPVQDRSSALRAVDDLELWSRRRRATSSGHDVTRSTSPRCAALQAQVVDGPKCGRSILHRTSAARTEVRQRQRQEPVRDKRVRQALSMAIDRERSSATSCAGCRSRRHHGAPGVKATRPISTLPTKLDVDGAKKLLAAAGYGDGFEVQLNCPTTVRQHEAICLAIVTMWPRSA